MPIAVDSDSRFNNTVPIIFDGFETFGLWRPPLFIRKELDEDTQIDKFPVPNRLAGKPDQISQEIYGTVRFHWVLIMFNKPKNTLGWPKAGEVIRFPVNDVVVANL